MLWAMEGVAAGAVLIPLPRPVLSWAGCWDILVFLIEDGKTLRASCDLVVQG